VHSGDGRIMLAAGRRGLFERAAGNWNSVPVDAGFHADNVWRVASTEDGGMWMVVTSPPGIGSVVPTAVVLGIVLLLGGAVVLRRRSRPAPLKPAARTGFPSPAVRN
jgi:LPXTG-motif cell wall-anchored protein